MKRFFGICFTMIAIVAAFAAGGIYNRVSLIPDEIYLAEGDTETVEFSLPILSKVKADAVNVVKLNGNSLEDLDEYNLETPITISSNEQGTADISFDLLGVIPIKNIRVTVSEERVLIPGGHSIGVMLHTKGALVVGSMDVITNSGVINPAKIAGIEAGDIIEKIDGADVENAEHLSQLINNVSDNTAELTVLRGTERKAITIQAVRDAEDGKMKLGVWVRDSTVGVGTISYIDPQNGIYGGLGHPITDIDTGNMLSVKEGVIVDSDIIEIVKGAPGAPGELKGYFDTENGVRGSIVKNTVRGIYGSIEDIPANELYPAGLPAAAETEICVGEAALLCTLEEDIKEYSCNIVKIARYDAVDDRDFIIEITDEELLSRTGGIVQGMSGSPIIQKGKIVGAVTHVFVNDPARGYGISIENMLETASQN